MSHQAANTRTSQVGLSRDFPAESETDPERSASKFLELLIAGPRGQCVANFRRSHGVCLEGWGILSAPLSKLGVWPDLVLQGVKPSMNIKNGHEYLIPSRNVRALGRAPPPLEFHLKDFSIFESVEVDGNYSP